MPLSSNTPASRWSDTWRWLAKPGDLLSLYGVDGANVNIAGASALIQRNLVLRRTHHRNLYAESFLKRPDRRCPGCAVEQPTGGVARELPVLRRLRQAGRVVVFCVPRDDRVDQVDELRLFRSVLGRARESSWRRCITASCGANFGRRLLLIRGIRDARPSARLASRLAREPDLLDDALSLMSKRATCGHSNLPGNRTFLAVPAVVSIRMSQKRIFCCFSQRNAKSLRANGARAVWRIRFWTPQIRDEPKIRTNRR